MPYEVYHQLLEEIAQRWLTPALAMSVHTLSCTPLLQHRGDGVLALLPDLLGGERLGAFCLSEPQAGSDVAAMTAGSASPRARSASLRPRSTWPSTTPAPAASSAGR